MDVHYLGIPKSGYSVAAVEVAPMTTIAGLPLRASGWPDRLDDQTTRGGSTPPPAMLHVIVIIRNVERM